MELWEYEGMNQISLRMHQIRALKELRLPRGILNTEALMLILNKKYKTSDGKRMLLKYIDAQDDEEVMNRKTRVLSYLIHSPYQELEELIIHDHSVFVDSKHAGFAMPLISRHTNLGKLINDPKVSFDTKKEYLIELGNLIDKVRRIESKHKMFFADLNEFNFVIDSNKRLRAIDLDSSYIEGIDITPPDMAYYLLKNHYLSSLPKKYPTTKEGVIIPNENSDLYCYNMIVLNALSGERMFKIDIEIYYQYLRYLEQIGVQEELIDTFRAIYQPRNNSNPRSLLEDLPENIEVKANIKVFQKEFYPY